MGSGAENQINKKSFNKMKFYYYSEKTTLNISKRLALRHSSDLTRYLMEMHELPSTTLSRRE
jgi:hypothetical protein